MTVATTIDTPDGPFSIAMADGHVAASGWTADPEDLRLLIHPTLRPDVIPAVPDDGASATLHAAAEAVRAYYAGDLDAPARITVQQRSGEFREHAWATLRQVGPGEPVTYTELAERAGRPLAVRAAAGACAMNAAALFVPCHRVLRSDGSLGGFRYGLTIKRSLLDREAR